MSENVERYHKRKIVRLRERLDAADSLIDKYLLIRAIHSKQQYDGSSGSGNWGHEGRPGKLGGSAAGGGIQNRYIDKQGGYTSFSQQRAAMAQPHKIQTNELMAAPVGTRVVDGESVWIKQKNGSYQIEGYQGGDEEAYSKYEVESGDMAGEFDGSEVRTIIPDSANPNWQKGRESFDPDVYSEERRNAAIYTSDKSAVDSVLRGETSQAWIGFNDGQKDALFAYTGGSTKKYPDEDYHSINDALREITKASDVSSETRGAIDDCTSAIAQSHLQEDVTLVRLMSANSLSSMIGVPVEKIFSGNIKSENLVGKVVQDSGFMSCGSAKGTGYGDSAYRLKIYAPKGTEAIYAEPFSRFGDSGYNGRQWDGKTAATYFGSEFETILQRGTKTQITGIRTTGHKLEVQVQVVGCEYS